MRGAKGREGVPLSRRSEALFFGRDADITDNSSRVSASSSSLGHASSVDAPVGVSTESTVSVRRLTFRGARVRLEDVPDPFQTTKPRVSRAEPRGIFAELERSAGFFDTLHCRRNMSDRHFRVQPPDFASQYPDLRTTALLKVAEKDGLEGTDLESLCGTSYRPLTLERA